MARWSSQRWFTVGCLALLTVGGGLLYAVNQDWFDSKEKPSLVKKSEQDREDAIAIAELNQPSNSEALAEALGLPDDQIGRFGGVDRPLRDMDFDARSPGTIDSASETGNPPAVASLIPAPQAGRVPRLEGNENSQVAGLVAELTGQGVSPDNAKTARSSYFRPEPFDRAEYLENPREWLDKIRPGRAFDPAPPGENVTRLEAVSQGFHKLLQGEQIVLKVRADKGMPVVFYTPHVGFFTENLLTTVSVAADEDGIATVTYKAGPGSMGMVDILAASPVHSEQIHFRVKVDLPDNHRGVQP